MRSRHIVSVLCITVLLFTAPLHIRAESAEASSPGDLHALSAVLMDADSGRVLYSKEGTVPRANASTTKVMTCILALENGAGDDYVKISANAAAQPEVRLGVQAGEQYYLEDLLYSLMLQSHNDSAVAIAEHLGGSVQGFAAMMNQKARELGCKDTHFITPNGLDAEDSGGTHHTTAEDLARIMRYAIQSSTFLKITQTDSYAFSDLNRKRHFTVHNSNAFLHMTDGVLTGKTGYTGNAGYCYVCACQKGDRTFVISLLGAGWPGHKTYKWQDAMKLISYGSQNYEYRSYWQEPDLSYIPVKNGIIEDFGTGSLICTGGTVKASERDRSRQILLRTDETITYQLRLKQELSAPVKKGEQIGQVIYLLGGKKLFSYPVLATQSIRQNSFTHCAELVFKNFFH